MISNRIFNIMFTAGILCMVASCSQIPINYEKVLKLKPGEKIYTAHNIWVEKNDDITHMNYHTGKILTFGTEVQIVEALRGEIKFKDVNTEEQYTLKVYRKTFTLRPEELVSRIFTAKPPEKLTEGIRPEVLDKIKKGIVEKGMTRNEVILAYGYPPAHRTPVLDSPSWIYYQNTDDVERVIFNKKGIVVDIMKPEKPEVSK